MKKIKIFLVIFCSMIVTANAQYDAIADGNNGGNTMVIGNIIDDMNYTIGVRNGGLFPLVLNDYKPGTVSWITPWCGTPTVDISNPHCGAGGYTTSYIRSNNTYTSINIYIRYFVDIVNKTSGSPTYDQMPSTVWLVPEQNATLSVGSNFANCWWYVNGSPDFVWETQFTVNVGVGNYRVETGDAEPYYSEDQITISYAISPTSSPPLGGIGQVTFVSSESGVTYTLLKKNGGTWDVVSGSDKIGTGGNLVWTGLSADDYKIKATVTKEGNSYSYMYTNVLTVTTSGPLPTVYNFTGSGSYCQGTSGISPLLSNSETGVSYSIKDANNNVVATMNGITGYALGWQNLTAGTYTCVGTNSNGSSTMNGTVVITESPLPTVNAGPDQAICSGNQVTLNASFSNGTLSWNNSVTNNVAFTPTSTKTYTASVVSSFGCGTVTDDVVVTLNPLPTVNAGSDQAICSGNQVTLNASFSNGTLSWNNSVTNNVAFTPISTKTYTASVVSSFGCGTVTDDVLITVNELPVVSITQTPGNGSVLLDAGAGFMSYGWSPSNETTQTIIVTSSGMYTVIVANEFGCMTSASTNVTITGINGINKQSSVKVYPNPVVDELTIESLENNSTIQIINSSGIVVKELKNKQGKHYISMVDLSPGIYLVKIQDKSQSQIIKIVKNK